MPANKDLKRLVRARMRKTGEAYTAARAQLVNRKAPAPPPDFTALAGMSDATIEAKTGRDWAGWVAILDLAGASGWPHADIARHVHEKHAVPGWWSQSVTVGYERIKGLRAKGQRRGGGFEANKSRTFAVPVTRLFRAFRDRRVRATWLPDLAVTVKHATPHKYMRLAWPDGTQVNVGFTAKGRGKAQVSVQHGKLTDKAAATRMKEFWAERLAALAEMTE